MSERRDSTLYLKREEVRLLLLGLKGAERETALRQADALRIFTADEIAALAAHKHRAVLVQIARGRGDGGRPLSGEAARQLARDVLDNWSPVQKVG